MYIHTDTETVDSIVADITKDQAVALVCCYHDKPYHGDNRHHRFAVCETLRARGLLHLGVWAPTTLGLKVAVKLT